MILDVVTPDKSMVKNVSVEHVVLPGELGQMMLLPSHISMVTALKPGSFAYKEEGKDAEVWAFLSGGFAQVTNDKVIVLAETMEFANEVDIAAAELKVTELTNKMKAMKPDHAEYPGLGLQLELAESRLAAAKKKS